jgi:hypothetical protein
VYASDKKKVVGWVMMKGVMHCLMMQNKFGVVDSEEKKSDVVIERKKVRKSIKK